jgi:hypothetical protein
VEGFSGHKWSGKDPFYEDWNELLHATLRFEFLAIERVLKRNEKLHSKASYRVTQTYAGILMRPLQAGSQ